MTLFANSDPGGLYRLPGPVAENQHPEPCQSFGISLHQRYDESKRPKGGRQRLHRRNRPQNFPSRTITPNPASVPEPVPEKRPEAS